MAVSVSVIVPTYNRKHLLQQSLQSLRSQTHAPAEIIVVDDCSDDGTWESIVSDRTVVAIKSPRQGGKAAATNFALPKVSGDVVWVFDDDDVADSTAVERIVDAFEAHPDAVFVYGRAEVADHLPGGSLGPARQEAAYPELTNGLFPALLERCFLAGARIAARTNVMRELNGLDEALIRSQDYDFLLRIARRGIGVPVQGGPLYVWRYHDGVRGTQATAFDASNRNAKWLHFDQQIFRRLRAELALEEYCDPSQVKHSPERFMMMSRAHVMASKLMYTEMLSDFGDAMQLSRGVPLDAREIAVLERTFFYQPYYTRTALIQNASVLREVLALLLTSAEWRDALRRVARRRTAKWMRSVADRKRIGMQRATMYLALQTLSFSGRR